MTLATEFDAFESSCAPTVPARSAAAGIPAAAFLLSQRLWYRAPELSDAPLITMLRNDPRVRRTTTPRFPIAEDAAKKWIEAQNPWVRGLANDQASLVFGVKGAAEPIGYTGLFRIDWLNRQAEYGIAIDPNYWNQRYGSEVTDRMVQYAFEELNLRRVELQVLGDNRPAISAYHRAGFVLEGTRRKADFIDGRWGDVLLMSVLCEEWQARRCELSA